MALHGLTLACPFGLGTHHLLRAPPFQPGLEAIPGTGPFYVPPSLLPAGFCLPSTGAPSLQSRHGHLLGQSPPYLRWASRGCVCAGSPAVFAEGPSCSKFPARGGHSHVCGMMNDCPHVSLKRVHWLVLLLLTQSDQRPWNRFSWPKSAKMNFSSSAPSASLESSPPAPCPPAWRLLHVHTERMFFEAEHVP